MSGYILALYGSILFFIVILKLFDLIRTKNLNTIFITYTFILMIASIFQKKIGIEIKTETLILIFFNFLIINYQSVISIAQKIKKIKYGDIEISLEEIEMEVKKLKKDGIIDSTEKKTRTDILDENKAKLDFLEKYFKIESNLRKISDSFSSKKGVIQIYLDIIRKNPFGTTERLEELYPIFRSITSLRNELVHNFDTNYLTKFIRDGSYDDLIEAQIIILDELEKIIKNMN